METGDSHFTSIDRAELVPEAARVLREQGHPDMAVILENTTEGARKVCMISALSCAVEVSVRCWVDDGAGDR